MLPITDLSARIEALFIRKCGVKVSFDTYYPDGDIYPHVKLIADGVALRTFPPECKAEECLNITKQAVSDFVSLSPQSITERSRKMLPL